jgi:molybdopterin/thiamine biosynthesis adenylyltransferase
MVNVAERPAVEKAPEKNGKYWRQLDLLSPEKLNEWSFVVVGAGSVGSWAALALAKMGVQRMTVWDGDIVSEHNASVQVYSSAEVGRRKVEVLKQWIESLANQDIAALPIKLDKEARPVFNGNTILVMAVDNMDARKYLWDLAKICPEIRLVIDPRMGGEVLRLYVVNPHDPIHEEFYQSNLYSSVEAEQLPCTAQGIIYTSMFAAAFVAGAVSSFVNGLPFKNEVMFHCRQFKMVASEV